MYLLLAKGPSRNSVRRILLDFLGPTRSTFPAFRHLFVIEKLPQENPNGESTESIPEEYLEPEPKNNLKADT